MYCIEVNDKYALVKRCYGDYAISFVQKDESTQCKSLAKANAMRGIVQEKYPDNDRIRVVEV